MDSIKLAICQRIFWLSAEVDAEAKSNFSASFLNNFPRNKVM